MSYAEGTSVPIINSQQEIRRTLDKYGATGFAFGEQTNQHVVMFQAQNRMMKFAIPMPVEGNDRHKKTRRLLTHSQVEAEKRRRWR